MEHTYKATFGATYLIRLERNAWNEFVAEVYCDYGPGHRYTRDDIEFVVETHTRVERYALQTAIQTIESN